LIALAVDAVLSFSGEPLRIALRAGVGITCGGFLYLAWTLIQGYILGELVPGYASMISAFLILGGIQLAFTGLIGQYLAHVFEEVKGRPIYLLKQEPPPPRIGGVVNRYPEDASRLSRRG
jgi:glycosyltransferase involved in cell wall biosynthesis